jgi:D-cysteine desulfhydrase family pyridoxal phosphate-dependent enzyme
MENISRVSLAHLPTPIEPMHNLSKELGISLLVKRDDLTGLAFGGNKTRKLEFLLADAQASGATTLITTGALQSNHCRQTAAVAARYGMECILVLGGESPKEMSGNLLLDYLLGAELSWTSMEKRDESLQEIVMQAQADGRKPYLIPYGGSNPIGATAFTLAMREVLEQGVHPDWIVVASSSGGTQAGLVVGAELDNFQGKILGISIDTPETDLCLHIADLATQTARFLGSNKSFTADSIYVTADYLGAGYGKPGALEINAIKSFSQMEGIILDPVYTGRAAGGLIDLAERRFFNPGQTVLFWHTGGSPALFANSYQPLLQNI